VNNAGQIAPATYADGPALDTTVFSRPDARRGAFPCSSLMKALLAGTFYVSRATRTP
jgi:hypothetical protein